MPVVSVHLDGCLCGPRAHSGVDEASGFAVVA
jgi:hypothetical protein